MCLVLLTFGLGSGAGQARGDATKAQLVWSAPDASVCPLGVTADAIEREVEQLLGHRVFVTQSAEAHVVLRGGIVAARVGVRAWLEARDNLGVVVGRRELSEESGDCASLQHSAALVLSVLLDHPSGALEPPREQGKRVPPSVLGSAGVAGLYGPLPQLTPGVWLSLELGLTAWLRARIDGGYWFPIDKESSPRLGATMSAFTGGLALCPGGSPSTGSRFSLGACLGGQLGGILATPIGLDRSERVARLLAQATLELWGSVRVLRLSTLFVAAGPTLVFTRPSFYYTTEDAPVEVWRPRAYGMIARIGVTIGAP